MAVRCCFQEAGEERPRPFSEVAAKVEQRGEQYARTLCEEFPGIRLIVIPGLYERVRSGRLEKNEHGLFPSFLDGVLSGLDEQAMLIGGPEFRNYKTTYAEISQVRRSHDEALDRRKLPYEAKAKVRFAAGIWADAGAEWSTEDASVNVRTPAEHELAVRNAFKASGEYAWVYGEKSRFLTTNPTPLMREYFQANAAAHDVDPVAKPVPCPGDSR